MKTCKNYPSSFAVMFTFLAIGCDIDLNDQPRIIKEYDLVGFTKIDLGDALRLDIQVGSDFEVFAEGEKDDVNDLVLEVKNGTLTSHYQPSNKNRNNVKVFVKMPEMTLAKLHSATKSTLNHIGNLEEVTIILEGAAELESKLKCGYLELIVSGASEAKLNGQAVNMDAVVRGASKLFAQPLTTQESYMEVSGKSEATIKASQKVTGSVTGKSRLTYYGNPATITVDVSGDSHLIKQ